jgi:hypothetical protein
MSCWSLVCRACNKTVDRLSSLLDYGWLARSSSMSFISRSYSRTNTSTSIWLRLSSPINAGCSVLSMILGGVCFVGLVGLPLLLDLLFCISTLCLLIFNKTIENFINS